MRANAILEAVREQRADSGPEVARQDWIDYRPLDLFVEQAVLAQDDSAQTETLSDGLWPFIERRTPKQRLVLHALYWKGASVRAASELLGSSTTGTSPGSAATNAAQARKMLRQELLAFYAPDEDPDAWPDHAPAPKKRRLPGKLPPPEPVRVRWQAPQPGFERPEPAEFERRNRESRVDLAEMELWGWRGFTNGPPGDGRSSWKAAIRLDSVRRAERGNAADYWLNATPPDKNPRPWRVPYPQLSPKEQAEVDRREWSPEQDALAALMQCRPNVEPAGAGLSGVPEAFKKVWAGLLSASPPPRLTG